MPIKVFKAVYNYYLNHHCSMSTFLFDATIFGPIKSRRLGSSLGINLLPNNSKFCNFNCIYCECGWNSETPQTPQKYPRVDEVVKALEQKLSTLKENHKTINAITFAGNGEPTLHPDFYSIVKNVIKLRDIYYPLAKTAILTNGTKLKTPSVAAAINQIDLSMVKLDAGNEALFRLINQAVSKKSLDTLIQEFDDYHGELIVQSLFLKGRYNNEDVCNFHPQAIESWLHKLKKIKAKQVMLYTLDRDTPANGLRKASKHELSQIENILHKERIRAFSAI